MSNDIKVTVTSKDATNLDAIGKKAGKDLADGVGKGADQAAKSVDTATKKIKSDIDRSGAASKSAGRDIATGIGQGADKASRSVDSASKKIKSDLDNVGDAGREAGEQLKTGLVESLSSMGGAGSSLVGGLTDSISSGKAGMIGAGLMLGGLLLDGVQTAMEENRVGAMISAQTGAAEGEAGKLGHVAGAIFRDNFGESIEDVGRAMSAVFQNNIIDTSAPEAAITRVTEKVMTVAGSVEEESARVARSARTMVVNGLAGNISEALDMIQRASEKGVNMAGDLLDTVDEYSIQFHQVGVSGAEAFGLLSQAIQGGARDADVAADAIKEFNIRAQDGSATTARGFQTLGLDAGTMGQRIAAGGKTAHDALRETLNALQQMPPGVERSTAAVDLFGTKAEDMGDALFDMDLDNAAQEMDGYANSVERAANKQSDAQSGWDRMGKNISGATAALGEWIVKSGDFETGTEMGDAVQKSKELNAAMAQFKDTGATDYLEQLKEKYPEAAGAIDKFIAEHRDEAAAVQNTTAEVQTQIETLTEWIAKKQEAAGIVLDSRDAERAYQEAVDGVSEALEKNGKTHDDNTEKGRDNNEALDKLAKTALTSAENMDKEGKSVVEVNKHMNDARSRFIAAARAMGYSKDEAVALANKLRLIPRNVSISVLMRDAAARANLAAFKRALDNIPRTITVSTYVRGANITGSGGHQFLASGGVSTRIGHAAEGGAHSGTTLINEAGPEAVNLPNGSTVMTAGATRAMAERGLLQVDGILETAATGGARGRGAPAYQRTGRVDISAGRHSSQFIGNLIHQGWRTMDGNMNELIAPWLQKRAGKARRISVGDLTQTGDGGGRLESHAEATPLIGRHGAPSFGLHVTGDADQAVGQLMNRLINDGVIKVVQRA